MNPIAIALTASSRVKSATHTSSTIFKCATRAEAGSRRGESSTIDAEETRMMASMAESNQGRANSQWQKRRRQLCRPKKKSDLPFGADASLSPNTLTATASPAIGSMPNSSTASRYSAL